MRHLVKAFALSLTLAAAGCFNPDEPPCAYACGPNGECPDDYTCGNDNYCHLHGTGICSFSDASLVPPDLSVPENQVDASQPDLSDVD
jgi:hypothetical protein